MIFIPLLLKKFGPVPDAASSVLRLEQLMNLDVFQELRQSAAYSSLLDEINRQFLTHADEGVLKEASAALMHAKTFEDLEEVTELKLGQLKEETVNALGNAVRGKDLATAKFSDANLTELINTVRRLEHLSGITDCVETLDTPIASTGTQDDLKPVDVLLELLNRGTTNDELVEELTLRVLRTLSFYFMWKVRGFNNAGNSADSAELDEMIERRKSAFERITTVLTERADVDPVKISAAITLLELTTLFISSSVPSLASLQGPLDVPTQAQIMSVFDAVEKSFAKGTGRKLEPDENAEPEDDEEAERAEGEDLADESSQLMLEQRLCEFASKIVLAAFAHVVDVKLWKKRLARNQPRLGANYKEVVNFLDRANIGRAGTRRGPQKKAPAQPRQQTNQKSAEKVVEDEEEEEDHESQADADEHHDDEEEEEEEHGDGEQHDDGAETVVPADEDEEMMDA